MIIFKISLFLLFSCWKAYISFKFPVTPAVSLMVRLLLPQVETSSGSISPASFDRTSRCPDEVVRRIRVTAAFEDPNWNGKLLDTYDTSTDQFVIAPCAW